jgi:subtilisin family serine protease
VKRLYTIVAAVVLAAFSLPSCGGGGGSSGGAAPPVQHTSPPAPPPSSQSATCPSSGPATSSSASSSLAQSAYRGPFVDTGGQQFISGVVNVIYGPDAAAREIDTAAAGMQLRPSTALRFDAIGLKARVLSVDPVRVNDLITRLQHTPGVISAERAQYRHLAAVINANDPYYRGFGPGAPFFENSSTPGQWDMHVINVGAAWGHYSSLPARGAPIAVIDTGVDVTHRDLKGGKIIRQACFVTYPSSAAQTTGSFAVDTDGHGTNVAGIADADTNNSFGFAGVAFDAPLLAYRIFPTTPSGGCEGSNSPQCSTTDADEVSAINDAVAHGAKVINLSLGANGPLSSCRDTIEQNAVKNAISRGVVVVAAAGNESKNSLDCPAAYAGVIAVGAEGISGSSEVMASYSNWTGAAGGGGGGAYLVAPGGTASSGTDENDLHFVENITSSQMANASLYCRTDAAGASGDCRAGFAGTSQATPHVAGVVSLMLGLRPSLTPARIASDLCSTAHGIGSSKQGCGRVDAAAAVAKALTQ